MEGEVTLHAIDTHPQEALLRGWPMKKWMVTIIGTLLILGYFWLQFATVKPPADSDVSSLSDNASGLSRLSASLQKGDKERVSVLGEPLLNIDQLANTSVLVMTSVIRDVGEHEASVIREYVENGGGLVLSYHSQGTKSRLANLLTEFDINFSVTESRTFKNKVIEKVQARKDGMFTRRGERYGIYSPFVFSDSDCAADTTKARWIDCLSRNDVR